MSGGYGAFAPSHFSNFLIIHIKFIFFIIYIKFIFFINSSCTFVLAHQEIILKILNSYIEFLLFLNLIRQFF